MSTIHVGNCLDVMPTLQESSIDAIVCDPPYGLGFMGKDWDHGLPGEHFWREALRVAKPGAHLVAFGGTRTFHRLACAIEDAGWEIRDTLMWVYGSGFPKSLSVSKAIDKASGVRGHDGQRFNAVGQLGEESGWNKFRSDHPDYVKPEGITESAKQWEGWGTALKPAWEPIILARKPLAGTVAANVQRFGTGAMNIDGCRVESIGRPLIEKTGERWDATSFDSQGSRSVGTTDQGRWPANLLHDGSEEVVALFPETDSGGGPAVGAARTRANTYGEPTVSTSEPYGANSGSAARFFYTAKASREDRNWGTDLADVSNVHPTVKPHELMRWLCRLITPRGGLVLDPFCGSGSTGRAAQAEGFQFVGIELDPDYARIAEARMQATQPGLAL
jgi:DNA modification methylase